MDRRKLSLTLSEDDLRKNNNSQNNSRRQSPVSRELRESSEERLRARIRELLAEERNREYTPPPRPVAPIPIVVRRTPEVYPIVRSLVPALPLPAGRDQTSNSPYRRVSNRQYFHWDNNDTMKSTSSKPEAVHHRERWDDPIIHSKDNCEMCSMAKKAFDQEQDAKQKKKGSFSRHCEDLRAFQEEFNQ